MPRAFFLVILILGLILRLHNYTVYPQRGATSDEYTYAFLGLSLLTKGVPMSWSFFEYKNKQDLTLNNLYFPIVWPYFDHPPLNGLLVGGWAVLLGQNTFEKITLPTIRLVPIALSVISGALVFLVTYQFFNYQTALWALLIYTTAPIMVIQQRVVLAENLLTPLFLLAIYLYARFQKKLSPRKVLILGTLAGLAIWTKESGISVAISLAVLMIVDKIKTAAIFTFVLVVTLYILGYLAYGAYYGWDQFVKIMSLQSARDIGPQTLWYLLSTPIIVNKIFYDGWYYFGFFALAYLLGDVKRYLLIVVPALVYFLFLLFSLTQGGQSGWYLLPLFPFLAVATAVVLQKSLVQANWLSITFVLFMGMFFLQQLFEPAFGLTPVQFRTAAAILVVPLVFTWFLRKKQWFVSLSTLWFYLFILGNVLVTFWYKHPA